MTRKELEEVYYIRQEIKAWNSLINNLNADIALSPKTLDGMPYSKTNNTSSPTEDKAIKLADAVHACNKAIAKLNRKIIKVTNYIEGIEDSEIRQLLIYRCIDNLKWYKIGSLMNQDPSGCRKKYDRFMRSLKLSKNSKS